MASAEVRRRGGNIQVGGIENWHQKISVSKNLNSTAPAARIRRLRRQQRCLRACCRGGAQRASAAGALAHSFPRGGTLAASPGRRLCSCLRCAHCGSGRLVNSDGRCWRTRSALGRAKKYMLRWIGRRLIAGFHSRQHLPLRLLRCASARILLPHIHIYLALRTARAAPHRIIDDHRH